MGSIVKIVGDDLQPGQDKVFEFTVKGYKKACSVLVSGQGEVSLVFDKDNTVVADSLDIATSLDTEPDKRALTLQMKIEGDYIRGNMTKTGVAGSLSVYLIVE